jgi:hypothetical protein
MTLPGFTLIAIALCAAVIVWALGMARSQPKAEREGPALEQNAARPAESDDPPMPSSDTPTEASDAAAEDEGQRRYYVRRPASPSTTVTESEREEPAETRPA